MLSKYLNLAVSAAKGTMMAQEIAMSQFLVAALKAYRISSSCLNDEEVDAMAEFIQDLRHYNPSLSTSACSITLQQMMDQNYFTKSFFMTLANEKRTGNAARYEKLLQRTSERAMMTGC